MEKMLEKLHITLSKTKSLSDEGNLRPLISFICDVTFTFFSTVDDCFSLLSAQDLLFTVFQLTAQDQTRILLSGRCCKYPSLYIYSCMCNKYTCCLPPQLDE